MIELSKSSTYRHKDDLIAVLVMSLAELLEQRPVVFEVGRGEVDREELLPRTARHGHRVSGSAVYDNIISSLV